MPELTQQVFDAKNFKVNGVASFVMTLGNTGELKALQDDYDTEPVAQGPTVEKFSNSWRVPERTRADLSHLKNSQALQAVQSHKKGLCAFLCSTQQRFDRSPV